MVRVAFVNCRPFWVIRLRVITAVSKVRLRHSQSLNRGWRAFAGLTQPGRKEYCMRYWMPFYRCARTGQPSRRAKKAHVAIEALEDRNLLSAAHTLLLSVDGTARCRHCGPQPATLPCQHHQPRE